MDKVQLCQNSVVAITAISNAVSSDSENIDDLQSTWQKDYPKLKLTAVLTTCVLLGNNYDSYFSSLFGTINRLTSAVKPAVKSRFNSLLKRHTSQ
jgi:hypothetical protein